MIIAHIGVGVTVLGITVSSSFSLSKSIKMQPGESIVLGNDQITFRKVKKIQGPNYQGIEGVFEVQEAGNTYTVFPQKRLYTIGRMAMTESAIHASLLRDVYIVLGEEGTSHAFVVNIYIKPLVRFIWAGGFCILLGAAVSLVGKRRR
jgi:cytochrome c-type biogenesis protein CcmF